jgi:hypothetical protein
MKILVKFEQQPVLEITVNDTETGRIYFDLARNQHKIQKPYYKDCILWTNEYMIELALKAKQAFGWDWLHNNYDLSITAQLHKDLENSVGKLGFESIPEEYDSLLYDLHHCLHAIQFGPKNRPRPDNFQIEWFTDNSVALPSNFEFVPTTNYGDLILINPYVGHNPLQIYQENDFLSLSTTCRFHDIVKPGIVLTNAQKYISKETILKKFQEEDPAFVELHGAEKIKYYAGSAVIGQVDDVKIFKHLKNIPAKLILESVEFYD